MPTIKEKGLLTKIETHRFNTQNDSFYLIKIQAKAKSEKQRNATDDEEITVKIDNLEFPKPNRQNEIINSPASFNGGKLHNKEQIIYFIIQLKTGSHTIELIPQHGDGAEVQEVSFEEISIKNNQLTLNLNQQLEDRDKQPWITFVLVDIGVKSLNIETLVKWHWLDGDDIKIIINEEIQQATTRFRKDWIIKTTLLNILGKTETIKLTPNLPIQTYNYIELYADKTPTLNSVNFEFIRQEFPLSKDTNTIQKYKDEIYDRDYNKLDKHILSAVNYWNDFFSKQKSPPPTLLDPSVVKAMIYRESKLGYFPNDEITDVMQVWNRSDETPQHMIPEQGYEDKASEFINQDEYAHMSYSYPKDKTPPEVTTPKESIFWGVRWLYHKAQSLPNLINPYKRDWETWKGAIYNYNSSDNVEAYIKEVFSIYEKGVDEKGNVLWEK